MSLQLIQNWVPGIKWPIICNAPMIGAASPALAVAVTRAGGLGFIESSTDISKGSKQLDKLTSDLEKCSSLLDGRVGNTYLPIGISFITGHQSVGSFAETAVPIISRHAPAAVWLFAPDGEVKPHGSVVSALEPLDRRPAVFVQVGNVRAAREAARDGADVIVCQGTDAGGHQFRAGMGVISLVPSVRRMLAAEFPDRKVAVLAAGGIVNGDGVAAAMALGATGVVMGTRFTVSDESIYPEHRKQKILAASDGGSETFKSPFHDQVRKNTLWGELYDGRAIISPVHERYMAGASLEECQKSLEDDYSPEEATKVISTWAYVQDAIQTFTRVLIDTDFFFLFLLVSGTGVGMVDKAEPAGDIVSEVRDEAIDIIRKLGESL
ncbi:nitronate monooxygenase [Geosmithia morbida]|uniref:Nitronate monooxygenase n=1 Tax=Geosmithia morbida TaxID=1094350 RepID=A0A9P4Z0G8_9HYPO|nr:nitronate monooxygenase [Geosmithia morbida]KAF4126285.1 nitronate monooxygenase [Geosmithia morbida]